MFDGKDPDADVYVDVDGTLIPITGARYEPGKPPKVVLALDRFQVLLYREKLKMGLEEEK